MGSRVQESNNTQAAGTHLQLLLQAVGAEQGGAGVGTALLGSGVVGAGVPEVARVAPAVGDVIFGRQTCGRQSKQANSWHRCIGCI